MRATALDDAANFMRLKKQSLNAIVYKEVTGRHRVYHTNYSNATAKKLIECLGLLPLPGYKFHRNLPPGSIMYVFPDLINQY